MIHTYFTKRVRKNTGKQRNKQAMNIMKVSDGYGHKAPVEKSVNDSVEKVL